MFFFVLSVSVVCFCAFTVTINLLMSRPVFLPPPAPQTKKGAKARLSANCMIDITANKAHCQARNNLHYAKLDQAIFYNVNKRDELVVRMYNLQVMMKSLEGRNWESVI